MQRFCLLEPGSVGDVANSAARVARGWMTTWWFLVKSTHAMQIKMRVCMGVVLSEVSPCSTHASMRVQCDRCKRFQTSIHQRSARVAKMSTGVTARHLPGKRKDYACPQSRGRRRMKCCWCCRSQGQAPGKSSWPARPMSKMLFAKQNQTDCNV